jgi:hypothetical protein
MQAGATTVPDFSDASSALWLSKLPGDVRTAFDSEASGGYDGDGSLEKLISELSGLTGEGDVWRVPEVVQRNAAAVPAFGRARRLRLMGWMAKTTYPDTGELFRMLTGEAESNEGDEGSSAASGAVGVLFIEDIKAYIAALAGRYAENAISAPNVELAAQSAFILENEIAFTRGGL